MQQIARLGRGGHIVFVLACAVILVGGLKLAGEVLLPAMSAAFVSVLCIPPMRRLQRHRVPQWASIVIVATVAGVALVLVVALVGNSVAQFQSELGTYQARLQELTTRGLDWLQDIGLTTSAEDISSKINSGYILELVGNTALGLVGAMSNIVLVLLTVIFILLEANDLPGKLRAARGDPDADLSTLALAAEQIQKYIAIKAIVSAATGILAALLTWALGVDFPLLWGLLAFLFNFVPNVGSIIAAVPAVLLALVQHGVGIAASVAAGYLVINLVIGNAVEPRMMGRRLGLSPLVVFLSLVFWGWVWGPLGMLLSVPLTVMVKIAFEHSDDFRWLGIMLGPADIEPKDVADLVPEGQPSATATADEQE